MASKEHQEYQQEGMKRYLTNFKYPHAGEKEPRLISLMDTCVARGAMGGVMGGGLGVVFGLLMSAGGPMGSMAAAPPIPGMPPAFPPPAAGPSNAPASSIMRGGAAAATTASSSAAAPFLSTPPSVVSVRPPIPTGAASAAAVASIPAAASAASSVAATTTSAIRSSIGPQPLPAPMLPTVPFSDPIYGSNATAPDINSWASLKTMMKETGKQAKGNFKTWGLMSGSFAVSECVIEQARGTSDQYNGLAAGCVTGALLAARSGPQGMAIGCAGFASFSFAMEQVMHAMG